MFGATRTAGRTAVAALALAALAGLNGCVALGGPKTLVLSVEPPVCEEFTVPLDARGTFLIVPVRIAGKEYPFILDTGATRVIFDETLRDGLNAAAKTAQMYTPAGMKPVPLYHPPEAFLGSIDLRKGGTVLCMDVCGAWAAVGIEARGVVGMSVLGSYVVQVDPRRATVTLMTPDERPHPEWGAGIAMTYDDAGLPRVRAHVPTAGDFTLMIDTAYNGEADLRTGALERLGAIESDNDVTYTAHGIVPKSKGHGRLGDFRLGPYRYENIQASAVEADNDADGKLGLRFLSRHRVTFDFPHDRMYLTAPGEPVLPTLRRYSGIMPRRQEGRILVDHVASGSPAERAGIRAGDEILSIQGEDVRGLELWQVGRRLASEGDRSVGITVARQGRKIERTIEL